MKKENKELAKQKKAEQRKKEAQQALVKKCLLIGIPCILLVVLIVAGVYAGVKGKSEGSTSITDVSGETAATSEQATAEDGTLDTDTTLKAVDGDTVNIDYVGSIDGVEFDGGNTQGQGTDLTLGSGTYIEGFEDQIVGHKVGESFDVTVTFPENYSSTDLAGKEAVFKTTLNGIYK